MSHPVKERAPADVAARTAMERRSVYGFLAAIYRNEPSVDLLGQIKESAFRQALYAAGTRLGENFFNAPDAQLLPELAVDTRLFIGPGKHVSPHECVQRWQNGGSLWEASTAAVKRFIESAGVEYRPSYRDITDHISVELKFMQQVTYIEARAWWYCDRAKAANRRRIERSFIDQHLVQWVPVFCKKVTRQTQLRFSREMAKLTKEFIEQEHAGLQQCG